MRLKDIFIDIIRHDMLNPASAAEGAAELVAVLNSREDQGSLLDVVRRNTQRIVGMIGSEPPGFALHFMSSQDRDRRCWVPWANEVCPCDYGWLQRTGKLALAHGTLDLDQPKCKAA